jgi:hypothetical protein
MVIKFVENGNFENGDWCYGYAAPTVAQFSQGVECHIPGVKCNKYAKTNDIVVM